MFRYINKIRQQAQEIDYKVEMVKNMLGKGMANYFN